MTYPLTTATAFEVQVRKLGLDLQTCVGSKELRQWCEGNKNRRYVPEWLLERWGILVDPNVSIERRPHAA
jgi:hypothetical protein